MNVVLSFKKGVQNWIKRAMEDPIAKMLSKQSHLTSAQLETLMIDVLAENLASKSLKYDEKAALRQKESKISRGSFNRTLRQAKANVIRSIYTILLLGYFGILESTTLAPYNEVSNKLKTYTEAYRDLMNNHEAAAEQIQVVNMLRQELESMLDQLSKPWVTPKV